MLWQIGGNFEPILTACQRNWMSCPIALVQYIWFEVVTDVLDCLANESILWRILALLVISTSLIHLIYWKIKWAKEIDLNKSDLKQTDFKIQDLELKVNILTYKIQYGTWPFPHMSNKNIKYDLRDIQYALTKLTKENSWIKQLLTSFKKKKKNKEEISCNLQTQLSISNSNISDGKINYIPSNFEDTNSNYGPVYRKSNNQIKSKKVNRIVKSNFERQEMLDDDLSPINLPERISKNRIKSFKSSSDKSLNYYSKNKIQGAKSQTLAEMSLSDLDFSDHTYFGRKTYVNDKNTCRKFRYFKKPKIFSFVNAFSSNFKEQIISSCTSDSDVKSDTYKTLYEVKKKLENIHSVLQYYNLKNSKVFEHRIHQNSRNQKHSKKYDTSKLLASYLSRNTIILKEEIPKELSKSINIDNFSSNESIRHLYTSGIKQNIEVNRMINENKNSKFVKDFYCTSNKNDQLKQTVPLEISENDSKFNKCKQHDLEEDSTLALLHEAMVIKKKLLSQFDSNTDEIEVRTENKEEENKFSYSKKYESDQSNFKPQHLGKITEESSKSSFTSNQNKVIISNCYADLTEQQSYRNLNQQNSYELENYNVKNEISQKNVIMEKNDKNEHDDKVHYFSNLLEDVRKDETSQPMIHQSFSSKCNGNENTAIENLNISDKCFNKKIESTDYGVTNQYYKYDEKLKTHLTDSSSDASVNKLIDRLIESERKCKSIKSTPNTILKKDFTPDSFQNFADSYSNMKSENSKTKEPEITSAQFSLEKCDYLKKDNSLNNKLNTVKSSGDKGHYKDSKINKENLDFDKTVVNDKTFELENSFSTFDEKEKNFKNKRNHLYNEGEPYYHNSNNIESINNYQEENSNKYNLQKTYKSINNSTFTKNKIFNKSLIDPAYVTKNEENFIKQEVDDLSSYSEPKFAKIDDFEGNNKTTQEFMPEMESSIFLNSIKKPKMNLYHASCAAPSNVYYYSGTKSSSLIQRPFIKNNSDLVNNEQFKTKSNFNLGSIERKNPTPVHRRSKSYVSSRDYPVRVKNNKFSKKNSIESLEIMKKPFCTASVSTDSENKFKNIKSENEENLLTSAVSPKSQDFNSIELHPNDKSKVQCESINETSTKSLPLPNMPFSSHITVALVDPTITTSELDVKQNDLTEPINVCTESVTNEELLPHVFENNESLLEKTRSDFYLKSQEQPDVITIVANNLRTDIKATKNNENKNLEVPCSYNFSENLFVHFDIVTNNDQITINVNPTQNIILSDNETLQNLSKQEDNTADTVMRQKAIFAIQQDIVQFPSKPNVDLTNFNLYDTLMRENQSKLLNHGKVMNKEREVLVKPFTLDMSTSMSDLPDFYDELDNEENECIIFEIPKEITTEECNQLLSKTEKNYNTENLIRHNTEEISLT